MGTRIDIGGVTYEVHACITCGCVIVAAEELLNRHRAKGGFYHCPNGHSQGWTKENSQEENTRRERDMLKQENARLAQEVTNAQRAEQRAATALKSHKKRAAAGTCPCCKRTFANMASHMKREHPAFVESAKASGKVLQ